MKIKIGILRLFFLISGLAAAGENTGSKAAIKTAIKLQYTYEEGELDRACFERLLGSQILQFEVKNNGSQYKLSNGNLKIYINPGVNSILYSADKLYEAGHEGLFYNLVSETAGTCVVSKGQTNKDNK